VRYRKKERKTKKKMRGRGSIWGVNERKGGYVDGGEKKEKKKKKNVVRGWWGKKEKKKEKKKRGTGTEGERGKKLRKEGILGVVKKKYILKNRIVKLK
jgi:hypothetical protein